MYLKNKDRYLLADAYTAVRECECQHNASQTTVNNSADERIDMILNNLVVLNNKTAELVGTVQTAVDSGEGVEQWASEKIAVATSMIGSICDYYAKFKENEVSTISIGGLLGKTLNSSDQSPSMNTIQI